MQEGMHFQLKKKKLIGRSGRCNEGMLAWRHQYSSRRHALLCSLAGWMDRKLCYAWIGSDRIGSDWIRFSFVKVRNTPRCEKKVPYKKYKTIKVIHICAKSIHIYKKHHFYSIQKQKLFSLLVSFQDFKLSSFMSEEPIISREDDTTLEAFFIFKFQ